MTARQVASFCKDGIDRVRILELIDSEIEAFNGLIATLCSRRAAGASSSNNRSAITIFLEAVEADLARNRAWARRSASKRWLRALNQKRIPHYQRAMDCGGRVRDVRIARRRPSTAVNPM
jgi:hypothetical protein